MILKAWFIEEIDLGNGSIGHRQSMITFDGETGMWVRPDDRLIDEAAKSRWDQVLKGVSNVEGNDYSYCINPIFLLDYCNNKSRDSLFRKHGSSEYETEQQIKDRIIQLEAEKEAQK